MYRSVVIKGSSRAKDMAGQLQDTANRLEAVGLTLVSVTGAEDNRIVCLFSGDEKAVAAYDELARQERLEKEQKKEKKKEEAKEWHAEIREEAKKAREKKKKDRDKTEKKKK